MEVTDRPVLRSRTWWVAGLAVAALALVLSVFGVTGPVAIATVAVVAVVFVVAVLGWALIRSRRQRLAFEEELTRWAAERAVQEDRLRIARDLHDIASHGLGAMTVRAAAARSVRGAAGEAERVQALADIERAGRQATQELRRMLTLLRTSEQQDAPLRPSESFADLPRIVADARASGTDVALDIKEPVDASASAQLTVCAIVREALANVARHAGPAQARVTVRRDGGVVIVAVDDDGPVASWQPCRGAGRGLAGLRERVTAFGGTMEAGPSGRGYRVTATLPDVVA